MSLTTNASLIHKPVAEVFAFAATPGNWPKYHPNSLGVTGVTERIVQVGDVSRERANLAGRIGEGDWLCTEVNAPNKVVWTINNPGFKAQLTYAFDPQDGGTRFTRTLIYTVPMTGDQLAQFEQYMHGESEKAVQNLKRAMESGKG